MISFFVPGHAKGQPRPRAFAKRFGHVWTARVYDPGTAEGWKACVALAAKDHLRGKLPGPLMLTLEFRMARPKAHRKSNGLLRPDAPVYHTSTPDADNLAKAVLDALTQLGAWEDDALIAELHVRKTYADDDPGCLVSIGECWSSAKPRHEPAAQEVMPL